MGDEYGGERRKSDIEVGQKLTRIETIVENIEKQISSRFETVLGWQGKREEHCEQLEEKITELRIEQGRQGVKVGMFSIMISGVLSAIMTYFFKK